jgi:hypothetical protein
MSLPPPAPTAPPADEEEEEFNPLQFQQSLDDALAQARSLVSQWFPAGPGSGWENSSSNSGAMGLQELKDRTRVPRQVPLFLLF